MPHYERHDEKVSAVSFSFSLKKIAGIHQASEYSAHPRTSLFSLQCPGVQPGNRNYLFLSPNIETSNLRRLRNLQDHLFDSLSPVKSRSCTFFGCSGRSACKRQAIDVNGEPMRILRVSRSLFSVSRKTTFAHLVPQAGLLLWPPFVGSL